ncbi:DUF4345 family protein [Roseisalinus antarcticus]|uniref:DUF4345 domain-containing protein n=1 Tax=Roseisalinus antarcticus TaxID=254357 RepID=A0A1Y5TU77_9RHOB|nr:DUF4345 family protein [Roseisalinus antarcticus]SLN71821.1 hypothetical protein ROA7023_03549 [Roseisalinus antarcticus]
MDIINTLIALISIGLGLLGWLAPRYTMEVVDLRPGLSPMGFGEVRAASGALFVGLGAGALLLDTPLGFAMIGFAWGGAAIGRLTSLVLDGQTPKKWLFFGCEAVVAAVALGLNLPA